MTVATRTACAGRRGTGSAGAHEEEVAILVPRAADRAELRCLVGVDVVIRNAGLLDHRSLVSADAAPDVGRLVC